MTVSPIGRPSVPDVSKTEAAGMKVRHEPYPRVEPPGGFGGEFVRVKEPYEADELTELIRAEVV